MKLGRIVVFAAIASCIVQALAARDGGGEDSRLVVYPEYPAQIERDYTYAVSVTQGDTTTNLVVYNHSEKSPLRDRTRGGDVNRRFCEFAFAGDPVRVDIRVCEDVRAYKLFPARLRLQSSFDRENGVISVWVDTPHSFGLQLNDYDKTILSVFVDEPEDPADIPDRNDPTVLFVDGWMDPQDMATGVTTIDKNSPYTSMYIAPGAVFNSRLYLGKRYFRVHGRGMILDPFTDIFRFDQVNNRTLGVLVVQMQDQLVEDVKLVDARTFNFIAYHSGCTFRNVKALSAMMCSDGMTCGAPGFKLEKSWLYVGDNALVISGVTNGIFRDVTLGTSCKAIYVQGSKNTNARLEDVDVFRCDEGVISNSEPLQNNGESQHSFFFRNLSGVDCTLFPRFFAGKDQGTKAKTFGFENVCIPQSTGSSTWNSIGQAGQAVTISDSNGKPWTTSNYVFTITNLWVAGSRSNGFAAHEIKNPERISMSVVNTLAAPKIPAVHNRTEVNWTCPWKRYIGASLQRDVRLATREAGEQRLVEPDEHANLVADRNATKSVWQRCPSFKIKLDAMAFDTDGARIYRTRELTDSGRGIYCDVTDGFLRRGNGTYRLAFDVRPLLTNGVDTATIKAQILSNEKTSTVSFSVPNDGEWHRCKTDFDTSFDIEVTDLMGLHIFTSLSNAAEIDYKNISFVKWSPEMDLPESERILCVPVSAGATNTLDAALVTSVITNIVKQGAGTLVMSAIPGYAGTITIEGGVLQAGASANDLGAAGTVIDILDGASLAMSSANGAKPVANLLSGKTVNLYGGKNAAMIGKLQTFGSGTGELGENVNINLKDADSTIYFASLAWDTGSIKSGAVNLGGRTLAIKSEWKRIQVGVRFYGGGTVDLQTTSLLVDSMVPTFSGTGAIKANYSINLTVPVSASGWTINGNGAQIRGIVNRWPSDIDYPAWEEPIALAGYSSLSAYAGTSEGKSNTVFNVKGPLSGTGNLAVGPGWLNLHGAANTYSGKVTVTGQAVDKATILPGGGGIGLLNGAACFPDASSITFTNTARLAFMDNTSCTVPKVKFIALAGETQSISGGVYTARSTIAGITKAGAGALLVDSPAQVTGLADIQAGTLKLANRANAQGQTNAEVLAPMPVFASLSFASGTTLDLSDTKGYQVTDISGSPVVTNAGLFGVTGEWTLTSPSDVMTVSGENPQLVANNAAGLLAFAEGATFAFKNAATETAYSNAVVAAGSSGLVVARARGVMSGVNLGEVNLVMPQPFGTSSPRWQMRVADNNTTVRLFLAPEGGYAAWVAEKGIDGTPDVKYNGIERGVRYAFNIDPASSTVGEPIIKIVRDANGNPVVRSRDLAGGRDDVTFGILATENLNDWTTLVPMKKFSDGRWKPIASESSTYVFPPQMFFRYTIDVK